MDWINEPFDRHSITTGPCVQVPDVILVAKIRDVVTIGAPPC